MGHIFGQLFGPSGANFKRYSKLGIPKWADYVKTGTNRELCPYDPDWLYVRAASIVRKIYIRSGTGA